MKKYKLYVSGWMTVEVEAANEDEAIEAYWDGEVELNDSVIDNIVEVDEEAKA